MCIMRKYFERFLKIIVCFYLFEHVKLVFRFYDYSRSIARHKQVILMGVCLDFTNVVIFFFQMGLK